MGYAHTHLTAATAAVTNQFVTSTNMIVGAYNVANSGAMPTDGARHVTCTRTVAGNADQPGTLTVVGKDLMGNTISESLVVGAHTVLVTGTKWFASVATVTGVAWVIDPGTTTNDTIVVGCTAASIAAEGSGVLHSVVVNTAANGAVTIADANGTIAILKASIGEGNYLYDVSFGGYLSVTAAAATDVTIIHSGSLPQTYAM